MDSTPTLQGLGFKPLTENRTS